MLLSNESKKYNMPISVNGVLEAIYKDVTQSRIQEFQPREIGLPNKQRQEP